MTKSGVTEDAFHRLGGLEEPCKAAEGNLDLLKTANRSVSVDVEALDASPKAMALRSLGNRAKMSTVKVKLGRIMHKLYDLEPEAAPEQSLPLDLGVDLYQMEDYET